MCDGKNTAASASLARYSINIKRHIGRQVLVGLPIVI